MLLQRIQQQFIDSADLKYQSAPALAPVVEAAVSALLAGLTGGGKVLACGNGAGAALAQQFVVHILGRHERDRPGLAAHSLAADAAVLENRRLSEHYSVLVLDAPAIGRQSFKSDVDAAVFRDEIARARTFGFMRDVERLWAAGYALGSSLENSVVIGDDGAVAGRLDYYGRNSRSFIYKDGAMHKLPATGRYETPARIGATGKILGTVYDTTDRLVVWDTPDAAPRRSSSSFASFARASAASRFFSASAFSASNRSSSARLRSVMSTTVVNSSMLPSGNFWRCNENTTETISPSSLT